MPGYTRNYKYSCFNLQLLTITVFELLRFITQQSKNDEDNRKKFNSGGKCICHELIAILRHFGGASSQYLFPSRRSGKIPLLDVFTFCHSVINNNSFGETFKPRAPIQRPFEIEKECSSIVSFVLKPASSQNLSWVRSCFEPALLNIFNLYLPAKKFKAA